MPRCLKKSSEHHAKQSTNLENKNSAKQRVELFIPALSVSRTHTRTPHCLASTRISPVHLFFFSFNCQCRRLRGQKWAGVSPGLRYQVQRPGASVIILLSATGGGGVGGVSLPWLPPPSLHASRQVRERLLLLLSVRLRHSKLAEKKGTRRDPERL